MTTSLLGEVAEDIPFAGGTVVYRNDTGAISFWRDSGWRQRVVDVPSTHSASEAVSLEPACPAPTDLLVRLGQSSARVRSHDSAHGAWLAALVRDKQPFNNQSAAGDLALYAGRVGWWVSVSGEAHQHFESLPAAHWFLIRSIWRLCHPSMDWLALLHASAIAIDGRPIIFAGTSGSGKSSLAAYLVARGAKHLTDDIVPIDADEQAIWPVPTRASVKRGSWEALSSAWDAIRVGEVYTFNNGAVRLVDIDLARRCSEPVCNKPLVIFPLFEPGAATRRIAIDSVELLAGLGNTGTIYPDRTDLLRGFLQWSESVDAFILKYASAQRAAEEIDAILTRPT